MSARLLAVAKALSRFRSREVFALETTQTWMTSTLRIPVFPSIRLAQPSSAFVGQFFFQDN
jgi:hypothetical protein